MDKSPPQQERAALTWGHGIRISVAASPEGDYPAMMRSSSSAEFPAQLEQESKAWLGLTVLQYLLALFCFSESQRFLNHRSQWISNQILSTNIPQSCCYCWALIQEELPSKKSLLLLERYHRVPSCLANVRVCWTSWIFGLCVLLLWRRPLL